MATATRSRARTRRTSEVKSPDHYAVVIFDEAGNFVRLLTSIASLGMAQRIIDGSMEAPDPDGTAIMVPIVNDRCCKLLLSGGSQPCEMHVGLTEGEARAYAKSYNRFADDRKAIVIGADDK